MRTFTKITLAMSFALPAATTACDEVEVASDAVEFVDSVSFRVCSPSPCLVLNSPFVENWSIANFPLHAGFFEATPEEKANIAWMNAQKDSHYVREVVPSETGRLFVRASTTAPLESIVGTTFSMFISTNDGDVIKGNVKFIDEVMTPGPFFDVASYQIVTDVVPLKPGDHESYYDAETKTTMYSVCPLDEEGTRAIGLKNTRERHKDNDILLASRDTTLTLACSSASVAKGVVQLNVLPNSGSSIPYLNGTVSRNMGVNDFNALIKAFRAYGFGEPWTAKGMEVYMRHLSPQPLFDQIQPQNLPPTPVLGWYEFHHESVYNASSGMACKAVSPEYPFGVFRYWAHDPPAKMIPGFDDLVGCNDETEWSIFGQIAVAVVRHRLPGGSQS